jgi:hypothetical protein
MALTGDLASVDLAQVFQMLALNKKVGILNIHGQDLRRALYFDHRGVTFVHNPHRVLDRVVVTLVRSGRLDANAVEEVRDHAVRMNQPLADSLLAGGYLETEELDAQYRIEIEEEIYDLFFVKEANFAFQEGGAPDQAAEQAIDERLFFNCDSVIMEAARRIDEWTYISERVPTTAEVYVATADSIDAEQFGTDGVAVFELLDGRRNVDRVIESSGLSKFQVCKALCQLLEHETVAPVLASELVGLAEQCMAEGRLPDAICLYERSVGLGVGLPEVHSLAAAAYQTAEQYENAGFHLASEAEHRHQAGDLAGAVDRLLELRRLLPTDLRSRVRLVEITLGRTDLQLGDFDPAGEGKRLVELLLEFGDLERVRNLLEKLLLAAPQDPDLKKALVNVHLKAGDQKRVVDLYESIADDLVRAGKPLEAVGYLQKVLLLDRSRGDIAERVRGLYESDERSRRRGRTLHALATAFGLLLAAGAGYWIYDHKASEAFARIDVHEQLSHEDFAGAAAAYQEFVAEHPLATAVGLANAELGQIEAARLKHDAELASQRAVRDRELERLRAEYKQAWARQREQFLSGRPGVAFETLGRVRELVAKAGAPDDLAWALEQQVEKTWQRLRDQLAAADKLLQEHQSALAAADWPRARATGLRLLDGFEATDQAGKVLLPVAIRTRPAGATLRAGDRMQAGSSPTTTPSTVLCPPNGPVAMTAELAGFAPTTFQVDGRKQEACELVLSIVANGRISFGAAMQTPVGLGETWLAVGLRGGQLGIARVDGSARRSVPLGGLRAVEGRPLVQGERVFFVTNENTLESIPAATNVAGSWSVAIPGAASELVGADGRLFLVDRKHVLHCWEQSSGSEIWAVSLDSAASGPPSVQQRRIAIGTADGRVLLLDASDGRVLRLLRSPAPVVTRVWFDEETLWFAGNDAVVRAVSAEQGKVLWTRNFDAPITDADLVLAPGRALLVATKGTAIQALHPGTGEPIGTANLDGAKQHALMVHDDRVLVQIRRNRQRTIQAHDALLTFNLADLAPDWEFADLGLAPASATVASRGVAWTSAEGEVILFR